MAAGALSLACGGQGDLPSGQPAPVSVDPDPRPTTPAPLLFTLHFVNDSMLAIEYTVSDTIPFATAYLGLESATSHDHFPHTEPFSSSGWELKTRAFSPPRFTVHATDTFPARNPGGNLLWALALQNTAGGWTPTRWAREYIGPRDFTLVATGIPGSPMQQPGLELTVTSRGSAPLRRLAVYLDSGSQHEQVYGPTRLDSAQFGSGSPGLNWHVWIANPVLNGSHTLTLAGKDSLGRSYSSTQTLVVAMPTPAYRVRVIDVPGSTDVRAAALNTAGVVVGTYTRPDGAPHAFRWQNGKLDSLPSIGASRAQAINDVGLIAGFDRSGPRDSLVSWSGVTRTALAAADQWYVAYGVNDAGDVLFSGGAPFVYRSGSLVPVAFHYPKAMNNMGTIVGSDDVPLRQNVATAFDGALYSVSPPYPPAPVDNRYCGTGIDHVNDKNQMLGSAGCSPAAFLAEKGKSPYWLVNWFGTGNVYAMSRWTLVLGRLTDGTIAVWQIGGVVSLPALDSSDWTIDELKGVNDIGQIIAHGVNKVTGHKAALLLDPL